MNIHCFLIHQGYTDVKEIRFCQAEEELYLFTDYQEGMDFCRNVIAFRKQVIETYSEISNKINSKKDLYQKQIDSDYSDKFIKVKTINGLPSVDDEIFNLKLNHEIKAKKKEFDTKLSEFKKEELEKLNLNQKVIDCVNLIIDRNGMKDWMRGSNHFSIHHFEREFYHKNYLLE